VGCLDIQCRYRQEGLRDTKKALRHGSRCTGRDSNPINQKYFSGSKVHDKDVRLRRRTACEGRQDS